MSLAALKLFLKGIPPDVWRLLAFVLMICLYSYYWYSRGEDHIQKKWDKQMAAEAAIIAKLKEGEQKITTRIVTQYVDRIKTIREKGDVIIKEIPIVITKEADTNCIIPNGFVRLWNDSNKMQLSESSTGIDEAPSLVVLSDVAAQKSRESTICHSTEAQLILLQEWEASQQALHSSVGK